ncbi:hypothetical protein KCU64_g5478, partial [Aureobasidium melanogenum]
MRQDRINLESSSVFGRNFVGSQQSLLLVSPFALSQTHSTALLIAKIVMGFTTGFIGGIALTSSLFYISLNLHERNRLYQSSLLRQQSNLLRNITDPQPKEPSQTARHLVPGLADRLKYRWNTELEAAVRKIQHFDWDQWRREAEDKVSSVFSKGLGSAVDEAEKKTS